jgi:ElaB/YqjD/DUF883 family membrane-anchored ribosome-binding protein
LIRIKMEAKMDPAFSNTVNAPEAPGLPGDPESGDVKPALGDRLSGDAAAQAEARNGPAVLAQPPTSETSDATRRLRPQRVKTPDKDAGTDDTAAVEIFSRAGTALGTGYRRVASSTDSFAREEPWKAVAFAVLGGVIAGMLMAR